MTDRTSKTARFERLGTGAELHTAAYFQQHGFLVRRGVPMTVAGNTNDATDIDVLGLKYAVPLSEERLVVDCKDRRQPQPFQRILWTRGLSAFARADKAVVVTSRAPWQARGFAYEGRVDILELDCICAFLASFRPSPPPFGDVDPGLALQFESVAKRPDPQIKEVTREIRKLRQQLVFGNALTNLNRIVLTISKFGQMLRRKDDDTAWLTRFLLADAAVTASVMLVRFACESKWTPETDWIDHARKRLTYGDIPPQKARQLATLAFDSQFFEGLPAPKYVDELVALAGKMLAEPACTSLLPLALDFELFGRRTGRIKGDYVAPMLGPLQGDALRMGKQVLSVLAYAADVPVSIWGFWSVPSVGARQTLPIEPSREKQTNADKALQSKGSTIEALPGKIASASGDLETTADKRNALAETE